MYKAIFTDRKGVRWEVGGITLSDAIDIFVSAASLMEPFTITEMQAAG